MFHRTRYHPVRAIAISQKLSEKVALITGGTSGICRRNRSEFLSSREAIIQLLTRKWLKELDYPLIKELWAFRGNRIAVRFAYEWHDDSGNWFRSYGNKNQRFVDAALAIGYHHNPDSNFAIFPANWYEIMARNTKPAKTIVYKVL